MKQRRVGMGIGLLALCCSLALGAVAQQASSAAPSTAAGTNGTVVPQLVNYSGVLSDVNGKPLSGVVGVTFSLYQEETGGTALWSEIQNVQVSKNGRYAVMLGSTTSTGLPQDVFVSGEARWLGVQAEGQAEQPRTLLVAVPYALKAGDAETIGGLPASAFMLAASASSANAAGTSASAGSVSAAPAALAGGNTTSDVTTTGGTVNDIPLFSTSTNIQNSILSQTGTTSVSVAGALKLPATGTATATAGKNSQPQDFVASSFNSSTSAAENQTFQWQAEPASNDTTSPSGTLNLLYGLGATAPSETGLKLSSKGLFTFATGQTFPGTGTITGVTTASGSGLQGGGTTGTLNLSVPSAGITNTMLANSKVTLNASTAGGLTVPGAMTLGDTYTIGLKTCSANQVLEYIGTAWTCTTPATGTVTSVATGAGLTGGPITGSGTLSIPNAGVTNAMLANSKVTLNSGTGITAPGAMTLGDTYTLSINTAVVPQLTAANTFTNVNAISANNSGTPALNISNSGGWDGIDITASGSGAFGLWVSSSGDDGVVVDNAASYGVVGNGGYQGGYFYGPSGGTFSQNNTDSNGATAAYAFEYGSTQQDFGFHGYSGSTIGIGVYGQAYEASATGMTNGDYPAGVWGDSGIEYGFGVVGSADDGWAFVGYNDSSTFSTLYLQNNSSGGTGAVLQAVGSNGSCLADVNGNLGCTGGLAAVASVNGSKQVALNAIHSAEDWFEDAGSGQLAGGEAVVNIESVFGETVNTGVEYHVFLTPNGDCKGLYVAQKSATSFMVKELGGGTSSIAFDYRIMAKRKGFEQARLADRTQAFSPANRPNRPISAAGKRGPNAQEVRKQVQSHMKARPAAAVKTAASIKK